MKCDKVKELMPFIGDGSLEPGEEEAARRHMVTCGSCRSEYAELKAFLGDVREAFEYNAPETIPGFLGLVRQKIRTKKKERFVFMKVLPAAAVVILMISLSLHTFISGRTNEQTIREGYVQTEKANDSEENVTYYDLNEFSLSALSDNTSEETEEVIVNTLFSETVIELTAEDIIEMMDEDQLNAVMASLVSY